jgi:uncharacterized membrane protein YgdD (TMEM256/DUF423 family)
VDARFAFLGALLAGLAVALGAFGAHGLQQRVPADLLGIWETGARYQMYHALALLGVALVAAHLPASPLLSAAGWLFVAGIVLFSGSLYLMTVSGVRALGMVTPIGGVAFLAGWVCLAVAILRRM